MLVEMLQQAQKQVNTSPLSLVIRRQLINNGHTNLYMPASRRKCVTRYFKTCSVFHLECILSCKKTRDN